MDRLKLLQTFLKEQRKTKLPNLWTLRDIQNSALGKPPKTNENHGLLAIKI
jgi:hypothetical protein